METIIVDDEILAIQRMERLLGEYENVKIVKTFNMSRSALDYASTHDVELAFLDINMPEIDGMTLANHLKEMQPNIKIVFITGYENFAVEAFEMNALDYLVKPVRKERLMKTISRLFSIKKVQTKTMKIQNFNKFECSVTDELGKTSILNWRTKKVKELFAYLTCHYNMQISRHIIMEELWPNFILEKAKNNLNSNIYYLKKELQKFGFDDMILSNKEYISLDLESHSIDIDIHYIDNYDQNKREKKFFKQMILLYKGDYLDQEGYPWAKTKRNVYYNQIKEMLDMWISGTIIIEFSIQELIQIVEVFRFEEVYYYVLIHRCKEQDQIKIALEYYDRLCKVTETELGVKPTKMFEEI